jgi:RHS repeat-associated protein
VYDPYGSVTVSDGAGDPVTPNAWGTSHSVIGNPYLFTGRQLDEETGLYYYWARSYQCALGRFLQRDPLGYWSGTSCGPPSEQSALNGYCFVRNNPTAYTDPLGLEALGPELTWTGSGYEVSNNGWNGEIGKEGGEIGYDKEFNIGGGTFSSILGGIRMWATGSFGVSRQSLSQSECHSSLDPITPVSLPAISVLYFPPGWSAEVSLACGSAETIKTKLTYKQYVIATFLEIEQSTTVDLKWWSKEFNKCYQISGSFDLHAEGAVNNATVEFGALWCWEAAPAAAPAISAELAALLQTGGEALLISKGLALAFGH